MALKNQRAVTVLPPALAPAPPPSASPSASHQRQVQPLHSTSSSPSSSPPPPQLQRLHDQSSLPSCGATATVTFSHPKQHHVDIPSSSSSHAHHQQQQQQQAPATPTAHTLASFPSTHTSTDSSPVLGVLPSSFCSTTDATSTSSTAIATRPQHEHSQHQHQQQPQPQQSILRQRHQSHGHVLQPIQLPRSRTIGDQIYHHSDVNHNISPSPSPLSMPMPMPDLPSSGPSHTDPTAAGPSLSRLPSSSSSAGGHRGPFLHAQDSVCEQPVYSVARHLCDLETDEEFADAQIEDVWSVATKRRGVYNLIQVPHRLERLLFFAQAVCLHDFLSVFTVLPLRLMASLLFLLFMCLSYPFRCVWRWFKSRRSSSNNSNNNSNNRKQQQQQSGNSNNNNNNNNNANSNNRNNSPRKRARRRRNRNNATQRTSNGPSNDSNHSHGNSQNARTAKHGHSSAKDDNAAWTQRVVLCAIDAVHVSLLVVTVFVLRLFDTSRIYHGIRGQSAIKLYVVFNMIEIFDRLCSSFGVDMLDSLGWTTASAVSFLCRRRKPPNSPSSSSSSSSSGQMPSSSGGDNNNSDNTNDNWMTGFSAFKAIALLTRVFFDYLFALAYVLVHSTLLLTWVVTLNVCINTQNNALLTLLVSNNFVELKGHTFKSFKVPNVFQIACADAVERFQLSTFLMLMLADGRHPKLLYTWGVIYLCEIAVDWIKHAFMLKFNRIPHRVYRQFGLVIAEAIVRAKRNGVVRSVGGSTVSKRIGFVTLPLAALAVRLAAVPMMQLPKMAVALVWLIVLAVKCTLNICITGHAWRRVCKGFDDGGSEEERERDIYWVQKLLQVERYDLVSK